MTGRYNRKKDLEAADQRRAALLAQAKAKSQANTHPTPDDAGSRLNRLATSPSPITHPDASVAKETAMMLANVFQPSDSAGEAPTQPASGLAPDPLPANQQTIDDSLSNHQTPGGALAQSLNGLILRLGQQAETRERQLLGELKQLGQALQTSRHELNQARAKHEAYKVTVRQERQAHRATVDRLQADQDQLREELRQARRQAETQAETPATISPLTDQTLYEHPTYLRLRDQYFRAEGRINQLQAEVTQLRGALTRAKSKANAHREADYRQLLKDYQQLSNQQKQVLTSRELLESLLKRVKAGNFKDYQALSQLVREADAQFHRLADSNQDQARYLYGYLAQLGDQWYLISNGDRSSHSLLIPESLRPHLVDGAPARAFQRPHGLTLIHIYRELPHYTGPQVASKPHSAGAKRRETDDSPAKGNPFKSGLSAPALDWLAQQRLLLVGCEVGIKDLVHWLLPLAADVTLIDAYERSPKRVQKEIKAHDLILIFTGSVPHSVTDYTHDDHPLIRGQIFEFYHPKVEPVMARLNLTYWQTVDQGTD